MSSYEAKENVLVVVNRTMERRMPGVPFVFFFFFSFFTNFPRAIGV